jgi:hypothetical protein
LGYIKLFAIQIYMSVTIIPHLDKLCFGEDVLQRGLSGKPCIFIATSDYEKWQFVAKHDLSMFVKVAGCVGRFHE